MALLCTQSYKCECDVFKLSILWLGAPWNHHKDPCRSPGPHFENHCVKPRFPLGSEPCVSGRPIFMGCKK